MCNYKYNLFTQVCVHLQIFGPLLPIIVVDDLNAAIQFINARSVNDVAFICCMTPIAIYILPYFQSHYYSLYCCSLLFINEEEEGRISEYLKLVGHLLEICAVVHT